VSSLLQGNLCGYQEHVVNPFDPIYEHFCLPVSLSVLLNLALGLPPVKARFLQAIGFVVNACLNIPRVNMNGSK